jgi:hypothetical protein
LIQTHKQPQQGQAHCGFFVAGSLIDPGYLANRMSLLRTSRSISATHCSLLLQPFSK